MKTLIVMRHARSSWKDPGLDDRDRPLKKRGRKAAPVMARWLAAEGHLPDVVLCSAARRARETVERMRKAVPALMPPEIEEGLYLAGPSALRERLARLPAGAGTAMLVGHQPAVGALVRELADGREGPRCRRAREKFPTGAAAVLEMDLGDWSGVAPGRASFVDFVVPSELLEG